MTGASAVFYDGVAARPRAVTLRFGPDALEIVEEDKTAARWAYPDIKRLSAGPSRLRVKSLAAPQLARLEVEDEAAAAELMRRSPQADERTTDRRTLARIVGWSLAATVSLVATAVYLVPVAADQLAPLVPIALERRIGEAVDNQVRGLFGEKACAGERGAAALAKLSAGLVDRARLPLPVEVRVLDSAIPNAMALPGGRVYLFDGLLRRAEDPDEVAGILAHEFGHVARRDGLRRLMQTGGSSFLLGLLFGDITGGGTLILLGRTLVDSSYSRDAEAAADRFAADLMIALGRSPRPMGAFLVRVTGTQKDMPLPFLSSHPISAERLEALKAREVPVTGPALLDEQEWRDLKSICKPG
ncbi:MAG TPA: M48 family metallopeptidase [Beijerinckiaceae bacterium]|jgi:Zn-dependent protease with chaperone function